MFVLKTGSSLKLPISHFKVANCELNLSFSNTQSLFFVLKASYISFLYFIGNETQVVPVSRRAVVKGKLILPNFTPEISMII